MKKWCNTSTASTTAFPSNMRRGALCHQRRGHGRRPRGRRIPKKIAKIDVDHQTAYVARLERPNGLLLATATLRPEQPDPQFVVPHSMHYLTLRVIPNPLPGSAPSLCELVDTTWVVTSGEMWTAAGSFRYTGASALDPLHEIPVVTPGPCFYIRGDLEVGAAPPGGVRPL